MRIFLAISCNPNQSMERSAKQGQAMIETEVRECIEGVFYSRIFLPSAFFRSKNNPICCRFCWWRSKTLWWYCKALGKSFLSIRKPLLVLLNWEGLLCLFYLLYTLKTWWLILKIIYRQFKIQRIRFSQLKDWLVVDLMMNKQRKTLSIYLTK